MPDTLAQPVSHTLEVKHSRFIAHAAPIDGAAAAMSFLQRVMVADATHNCWAYRHGQEYRSSDDGEPAGTAGRPILAAIDGQGFDRVMVVVIRWYGGIKLGAGGLVRAYGGTAAECLRTAPRLPLVAMARLQLLAGFEDLGTLHAALPAFSAEKQDEQFDAEGVRLRIELPADQADALKIRLRDATRDRIRIRDDDQDD
ncbi:YigZ family protein [Stenotrophomonas sp. TWI169]|uniref:IMPACT family protein n=1 Tax=Stenotrophomonas maltophilia TaxID=40324 RepID=A0AAP7L2E4_STEMA|nr:MULTISPECIES: YigZ family protein [Stenotrophomonas]KOQ67974.1 IMPACT family member in pol 5'region [Stenotrophomonas maltophilia]MBA0222599.1 YigZ family protein [Stenotrophomonas maltophilia]MBE5270508.1 YigZ family protein [Stenotrophomonas sp. B2]MBH1593484.1 YigZ family protein [Stenotrophomonas maltophilia]MBH1835439.1 YigZ family protein [Stenotrophomonas maltophilia]